MQKFLDEYRPRGKTPQLKKSAIGRRLNESIYVNGSDATSHDQKSRTITLSGTVQLGYLTKALNQTAFRVPTNSIFGHPP